MYTDQHSTREHVRISYFGPRDKEGAVCSTHSSASSSPPSSAAVSHSTESSSGIIINLGDEETSALASDRALTRYHGRDCLFGIASCPGCRYAGHAADAKLDERQLLAHRQFFFSSILGVDVSSTIQSPSANRDQLVAIFANDLDWIDAVPNKRQHLAVMYSWFNPRHPLASIATDSILVTHFAHLTKDERLQEEVRRTQGTAVALLQAALQKPNAALNDAVLVATDALGIRQLYHKGASSQLADNMARLLTAAGHRQLERRIEEQPDLAFAIIHTIITAAIVNRSTSLFSDSRWYRILEQNCKGRLWCLMHLQARITAHLERVDCTNPLSKSQANAVFNELVTLDRLLHDWLILWYAELPGEIVWTVSVTRLSNFVRTYGPIVEVFPLVFQYPSLIIALGHLYYWTTVFWVREALFILVTKNRAAFPDRPDPIEWSRRRANECVDSLCQSIPYLLEQPKTANPGVVHLAGKWYRQTGQMSKAAFCDAILGKAAMVNFQFEKQRQVTGNSHSVGADSFIFRRIMCLRSIGPSACCLRSVRKS